MLQKQKNKKIIHVTSTGKELKILTKFSKSKIIILNNPSMIFRYPP